MTTKPLPAPGESGVDAHVAMSRRLLEQAKTELLDQDDRLQASEKAWGAAAHALKAIGEDRGWRHNEHQNLIAIAEHLAREFGRRDFNIHFHVADSMHQNYYENRTEDDGVLDAIVDVEEFLDMLDEVRAVPPRPFTVSNVSDQRRLGRLLGLREEERPAIGDHSPVGFSRRPPAG